MSRNAWPYALALIILAAPLSGGQSGLNELSRHLNFASKRISSYDRSGGNNDRIAIPPGDTAVLAEIQGPAAIHHIWITIMAEAFYGRKLILRIYWDNEPAPSVEAPIGDFFGVGHGLNRDFHSLAVNCSSEGRARNCYWVMPFRSSARITVTNQGERPVGAFYFYIDYRELPELAPDTPTFHARYRQETPCVPDRNYLIMDAVGRGHYVGCCLSILQRTMGWWGEGDDMIFIDGESSPSLHGTGSEDYFGDAWGMREDASPYYGCPLQEPDFKAGAKATVYRHHIPDPIPFRESIRVEIEHGHANDRADDYSSVAYWYQSEPHAPFPVLPPVEERLPFALESKDGLRPAEWIGDSSEGFDLFRERNTGMIIAAPRLIHSLTPWYDQAGHRYPLIMTDGAAAGDHVQLHIPVEIGEHYDIDLHYLKGPEMGSAEIMNTRIDGTAEARSIAGLTLEDVRLRDGENLIKLRMLGRESGDEAAELGLVGIHLTPSRRRFITGWRVIGPFDAPDMSFLQKVYPPEREIDPEGSYPGKDGRTVEWTRIQTDTSGWVRLEDIIQPREKAVAYGLAYVHSPSERPAVMRIGSDDGVRIWLNRELVHTHPAYRGAYPDQDTVPVHLRKGWNRLLIKVLQGAGGWGYYVRFVDPEAELTYAVEPTEK